MVDAALMAQRIVENFAHLKTQLEIVIEEMEQHDHQFGGLVEAWRFGDVVARIWNLQKGPSEIRKKQMIRTVYQHALIVGARFDLVQGIRDQFSFVLDR